MKIGNQQQYEDMNKYYNNVNNQNQQIFKEQNINDNYTKELKEVAKTECEACKNRKYVDGSNDPGVSFKAPTKVSPQSAASAVFSHEREHYTREASKAESEDREVLSNEIRIFTSVCPECGKTYVSGGETTTVTRKRQDTEYFAKKDFEEKIGKHMGKYVDTKV